MGSWLVRHAPRRFDELAGPGSVRRSLLAAAASGNPPHLVIAGPAGVGKTAAWRLVARQVLGPGWRSTTHIVQARDLAGTAGAMARFEDLLRPGGGSDTLAGRRSLESFDPAMWDGASEPPPAGRELEAIIGEDTGRLSRLIVIEDADHLGPKRQPYLRRMMETEGAASRFIFTTRVPSRIIDALRSRSLVLRIPFHPESAIVARLEAIAAMEHVHPVDGLLGDLAHVAGGNLRQALFMFELLAHRERLADRSAVHELVTATTHSGVRHMLESALRGRVHHWVWEKQGTRNVRQLRGAMGELDHLMGTHALDGDDLIDQLHQTLTRGALLLPEPLLASLLDHLAQTDVDVRHGLRPRIQLERFLLGVADLGRAFGMAA